MANYHYDEAGNMAAYFVITFLAFILVPLTLSWSSGSKQQRMDGCQCQPCIDQRARVQKRERRSLLSPKISSKAIIVVLGWSFFVFLAYKTAGAKIDNKVYDPFEILGLRTGVTEKEIKSHFKKLSKLYHPDKAKLSANETMESIANKFVDITKAYKSLTDETIRRNWELYGHPDGRQEVSMGIALPQWIIEGKNNIWVLGMYGLLFGGVLPVLVGRWWFGSRQKTKDGVNTLTAAAFFKSLKEEGGMDDVVGTLGRSYAWEMAKVHTSAGKEVNDLEKIIRDKMGKEWSEILKLAGVGKDEEGYEKRKTALVLLYAHFLRLDIVDAQLHREQARLLLQTTKLLNALLVISTSRSWLAPTLSVMRLQAYLAQALLPGKEQLKFAQLPGIKLEEKQGEAGNMDEFVEALEEKGDGRINDVRRALQGWGRLEFVDANFKVIGERVVTSSSIVYLVVKLRRSTSRGSLLAHSPTKEKDVEEIKRNLKLNEEKDNQFLASRKDAEDDPSGEVMSGWAHAPYWPGYRKPAWWLVLADHKSNRIVVPPMKITDVPFSKPELDRNYRSYKLQFQAPNSVGLFTWKVYLVSDTFVGEEICEDIALKIDDITVLNADEQGVEDEISDPEEDSLAGQMTAIRGGSVKKVRDYAESDEESSTDDDQESGSSSNSETDSD